jgi:hypothetical protein
MASSGGRSCGGLVVSGDGLTGTKGAGVSTVRTDFVPLSSLSFVVLSGPDLLRKNTVPANKHTMMPAAIGISRLGCLAEGGG